MTVQADCRFLVLFYLMAPGCSCRGHVDLSNIVLLADPTKRLDMLHNQPFVFCANPSVHESRSRHGVLLRIDSNHVLEQASAKQVRASAQREILGVLHLIGIGVCAEVKIIIRRVHILA